MRGALDIGPLARGLALTGLPPATMVTATILAIGVARLAGQ